MNALDLLKLAGVGIVSLGGVAALVFPLAGWLGKVWADRLMASTKSKHESALEVLRNEHRAAIEQTKAALLAGTELHRTRLRFSDLLFQRELNAASALVSLTEGLAPVARVPDMDLYDLHSQIAADLAGIEAKVSRFLREHGVALSDEERNAVSSAQWAAGQGKFVHGDEQMDQHSVECAENVLSDLKKAEQHLLSRIRSKAAPIEDAESQVGNV